MNLRFKTDGLIVRTKVFSSREEFMGRPDKRVNGVSKDYAELFLDWEEQNSTNFGCWECHECTNCYNCTTCSYCTDCEKCSNSINLTDCRNCEDCDDCGDSYNLKRCYSCYDSDGCTDCRLCHDCHGCKGCRECQECYTVENSTRCIGAMRTQKQVCWSIHLHKGGML